MEKLIKPIIFITCLFFFLVSNQNQVVSQPQTENVTIKGRQFTDSKTWQKETISVNLQEPLSRVEITGNSVLRKSTGSLVTVLSEDFEGAFPSGLWAVSTGDYTWGKRDVVANSGSYSAWAVGGGTKGTTLAGGANYPNSVNTWMVYGPFDLSDANWAAFSFYVWLNTQSNDYFKFLTSTNGTNFYGYQISGSTSGSWIPFSFALTAVPTSATTSEDFTGNSAVWIAFVFTSDASSNLPNGVFVDDILLQKGMLNKPDIIASFNSPGSSPRGLAFDGVNLWNADAENVRIYKLTTSGSVISSLSSPSSYPTGLTWDGTNLWNADYGTSLIYKLSTSGTVLSSFAAPGYGASGLAWDGTNFWYCDFGVPTIWKLSKTGAVLSTFSAPGTFHYGIAWDGQHVFLVDAETLLIYKMDPSGNVLDYYPVPETNPSGLVWDGNYLWLADRNTDKIYKLQLPTSQISNDVGVIDMNLPNTVILGESAYIGVVVKNFGTATQTNFPVSYSINGGAALTENFTDLLTAGATSTITFATPWIPATTGNYSFTAWTGLVGDENPTNDNLPQPKEVVVKSTDESVIFTEDFESYPVGVLADAPGSPWIRLQSSRTGDVTTTWVHGGQKNFQTASFTTSTEIDYVNLDLDQKPDQINVELLYTPDGFFIYKDFAEVGLGYATSTNNMMMKAGFAGSNHDVLFKAEGMSSPVTVFNELEYGGGPAPSGTPQHNYIRAEFDFLNNQVRFYIGASENAPLRSVVDFNGNLDVNALYIAGGLNPTFIDDIRVVKGQPQPINNDVGVTSMDMPNVVIIGNSVSVKANIRNFGKADQSNFPVSYNINDGPSITENFNGTLAAGATATKTFSMPWVASAEGTFRFMAWTSLSGDENTTNDTLPAPHDIVVEGTNHAPSLSTISNQTVTAGQIKNVGLSATDTDGDALSFSIPMNPGFLSIIGFSQVGNTATATLIIAPSTQTKGTFNATVHVSDDKGGIDSKSFTIQVQEAQQFPIDAYRVVPIPKSMTPLSGSTTQIFGPNTFWELSSAISLPFTFTYLDQSYNQIKVSSNGFLTFDVSESYHYLTNDLSATRPKNALAPLWDYLNIGSSGMVHYQTQGSAPNRVFVVEFYHVVWGPFSSPVVDYQILLYEGSNDIEFHYGAMADAGFGADGASIGIKDDQGHFINALDGSRDVAQNEILKPPRTNFRFTTSPPPAKDVGVAKIMVDEMWFVGTPDTIRVIVENHGSEDQTGFTVAYQIEGENPVHEIFAVPLPVGSQVIMKFNTTWEPKKGDLYSINAWTELVGDANSLNDSTFVEDAITVYELELPPPTDLKATNEIDYIALNWNPGSFQKPLPGEWNGTTNEGQDVYMIVNFNSTKVDSCEIYYMVSGDPFPFPLKTYAKCSITNNQFSFYYSDQYGRMSTDVDGIFVPPDSCYGTWSAGVYVNNVYTVFEGTWIANAEFDTPQLLGFQIYRDLNQGVQIIPANLLAEITDPIITSFADNQITNNIHYYYVVVANYDRGTSLPSNEVSLIRVGVETASFLTPSEYCLYPAYPNPFNPQTTVVYDLPQYSKVNLKIYNILGEMVAKLVDEWQPAGHYEVRFRADELSSGIYFLIFESGPYRSIKRVTLLK